MIDRPATDEPVITTINGRRVRWLGNFASTSPELYRRYPGGAANIVDAPYPGGKLSVAELKDRGLRGAYEPV